MGSSSGMCCKSRSFSFQAACWYSNDISLATSDIRTVVANETSLKLKCDLVHTARGHFDLFHISIISYTFSSVPWSVFGCVDNSQVSDRTDRRLHKSSRQA